MITIVFTSMEEAIMRIDAVERRQKEIDRDAQQQNRLTHWTVKTASSMVQSSMSNVVVPPISSTLKQSKKRSKKRKKKRRVNEELSKEILSAAKYVLCSWRILLDL